MPLQSRKNATCSKLQGVEVENIKCNERFVYTGDHLHGVSSHDTDHDDATLNSTITGMNTTITGMNTTITGMNTKLNSIVTLDPSTLNFVDGAGASLGTLGLNTISMKLVVNQHLTTIKGLTNNNGITDTTIDFETNNNKLQYSVNGSTKQDPQQIDATNTIVGYTRSDFQISQLKLYEGDYIHATTGNKRIYLATSWLTIPTDQQINVNCTFASAFTGEVTIMNIGSMVDSWVNSGEVVVLPIEDLLTPQDATYISVNNQLSATVTSKPEWVSVPSSPVTRMHVMIVVEQVHSVGQPIIPISQMGFKAVWYKWENLNTVKLNDMCMVHKDDGKTFGRYQAVSRIDNSTNSGPGNEFNWSIVNS